MRRVLGEWRDGVRRGILAAATRVRIRIVERESGDVGRLERRIGREKSAERRDRYRRDHVADMAIKPSFRAEFKAGGTAVSVARWDQHAG